MNAISSEIKWGNGLAVSKPLEIKVDAIPKHKVIALDPGCRTFLTGYSPDGKHMLEVGDGTMERWISKLEATLDDLISRYSKEDQGQEKIPNEASCS